MTSFGPAQIGSSALYYEQFKLGAQWGSPRRTITETDALLFAGLTGDLPALCFDTTMGGDQGGKVRSVNAACSLALATGLEQRLGLKEGTGLAFLAATWFCHRPVFVGQSVRMEQVVVKKRATRNPGRGIVVFEVRLVSSREDILCTGKWTLMLRRDPAAAEGAVGEPNDVGDPNHGLINATMEPHHELGHTEQPSASSCLTSPRRTVTKTDIGLFCALTGDYNPAHSDAEFARTLPFGRRVMQGPAALALGFGLTTRLNWPNGLDKTIVGIDWTFRSPIVAGDDLRVVLKKGDQSPTGTIYSAEIFDQRDQSVQSGTWLIAAQ